MAFKGGYARKMTHGIPFNGRRKVQDPLPLQVGKEGHRDPKHIAKLPPIGKKTLEAFHHHHRQGMEDRSFPKLRHTGHIGQEFLLRGRGKKYKQATHRRLENLGEWLRHNLFINYINTWHCHGLGSLQLSVDTLIEGGDLLNPLMPLTVFHIHDLIHRPVKMISNVSHFGIEFFNIIS
jgi:hypothetical protein